MHLARPAAVALLAMSLSPGTGAADTEEFVVRGEIHSGQSILLPTQAVIEVRLEDTSLADAPEIVLAETVIQSIEKIPIPFELGVRPEIVHTRHMYGARARILENDSLRWTGTAFNPAQLDGNDYVRIRVQPAPATRSPTAGSRFRAQPGANTSELARAADYMEIQSEGLRQLTLDPQTAGNATTLVTAYFTGEQPGLIIEQTLHGKNGTSEHRYFLEGDWLYHYRSAGRELSPDATAPVPVERRIYLRAAGKILYGVKSVNGKATAISPVEAASLRRKAAALVQAFATRRRDGEHRQAGPMSVRPPEPCRRLTGGVFPKRPPLS